MKLMDNKLQKYDKDGECMRRQKKEPVVEGRERDRYLYLLPLVINLVLHILGMPATLMVSPCAHDQRLILSRGLGSSNCLHPDADQSPKRHTSSSSLDLSSGNSTFLSGSVSS